MTRDDAGDLATMIAGTWRRESAAKWLAQLLPLDREQTLRTITSCQCRYTGQTMPWPTFAAEYGPLPGAPTTPDLAHCDRCNDSGVLDIVDGLEQHCACGHGFHRSTTTTPTTAPRTRFLTEDEVTRGREHLAQIRARMSRPAPTLETPDA